MGTGYKGLIMQFKLSIFLAAALVAGMPAAAAEMVTAKDPQSVVRAMQAAGFQAKLEKDDTGDPMIVSGAAGAKFWVYFYNCTKNTDCATVQFHTSYDIDESSEPSLEKINEWNSNQRFGTAHIDKEGDPVLNFDLDLDDGGMSEALFSDNLEFWSSVMAKFQDHVGWK